MSNENTVVRTAGQAGTSRCHSRNPASTARPVTTISNFPTSRQAGKSSSTDVRPTTQANSGGYSDGSPGMIASALCQVTEYLVAMAVTRPASPTRP